MINFIEWDFKTKETNKTFKHVLHKILKKVKWK